MTSVSQPGCLASFLYLISGGSYSSTLALTDAPSGNPFDYIAQARARREREKLAKEDHDRQTRERDHRELIAHGVRLDELARPMLEALRLQAYAHAASFYQVRSEVDYTLAASLDDILPLDVRLRFQQQPYAPGYFTWKISTFRATGDRKGWEDALLVALEFWSDRQPSGFWCSRQEGSRRTARARLSPRALLEALKTLYPADQA